MTDLRVIDRDTKRNERLAQMIRRYWRALGVTIEVRLEDLGTNKERSICIRSSLVNGLPEGPAPKGVPVANAT
jgi:hypothetical protein